jgi:hypothetical protein
MEGRAWAIVSAILASYDANLDGSVARFGSTQKPKPTPITELAESRNRN